MAAVHAAAAGPAGCRLTAVASASGRSARPLAGEADASRVRPEQLPAGADILVVATPPAALAEVAAHGLGGGAVVLVEAPWCATPDEADHLLDLAAHGPGMLRGAAPARSSPTWRATLGALDGLGTVRHLSGRCTLTAPDWGHLGAGADEVDSFRLTAATALPLIEDLSGGRVASVAVVRSDGVHLARLLLHTPQGELEATVELHLGVHSEVWFQAAADDGVVRVELAPNRSVELHGELVDLPVTDGPVATLVDAGYVDQLARLGGPEDLTLDPSSIRRLVAATTAGIESLRAGGSFVTVP